MAEDDARQRARCRAMLARYLHRYWYRAVQGGSTLGDLFVTIEEISVSLEAGRPSPPMALPALSALNERIEALRIRDRSARADAESAPGRRLTAELGVSEEALELLQVASALQRDPSLLRAATFAWADFSIKQPTAGFLVELVADDSAHAERLERELDPGAPLAEFRLLRLSADRQWHPRTPLLQRLALVPEAVERFLRGWPPVGDEYPAGAVGRLDAGPRPEHLVLHDAQRLHRLLGACAWRRDRNPVLLVGGPGTGRRTAALAHAVGAGRALLVVDLSALAEDPEVFNVQLRSALRDARLLGALPLLRADTLSARGDRRRALLAVAVRAVGDGVVLTASADSAGPLAGALPEAYSEHLREPPVDVRERLYGRLFAAQGFSVEGPQRLALSDAYRLSPGDLDRALRDLRASSGPGARLDAGQFDQAVRRQVRTRLSDLATHVTTSQRWEDLIIKPEQRLVIEEILAHARHKSMVFEAWGFSRKVGGRGRGLSCLFSGPPGTGKTMTASLIARELGLDLFQVDLSRVVDKYIGETEKNLARLFDEAARVPVVLLFDEADSLFASRTKVESSNDRYANLEVNFLLQRMETFDGISILTTNLGTGIDQAFKRRLRFRLHFELPGPEEREILWRSMVPAACRVAEDVDWGYLARRWEMSGALIRNAVLRAAFLAAARGEPLTDEVLRHAARSELFEMGRLGS